MTRTRKFFHVLPPMLVSLSFFTVALTPVQVLGCRTRGLIALSIALFAGVAGITTAIRAILIKARKQPDTHFWIISTLILAVPPFYIVVTEL